MAEHNDLGKWGEDEAALFLERKGYIILERDWKMGKRDLDIIALTEDQQILAVVEVKTRKNEDYQEPEEAVNCAKMKNLAVATNAYVKLKNVRQEVRFDIVSVVGNPPRVDSIIHIEDAFNPLLIM